MEGEFENGRQQISVLQEQLRLARARPPSQTPETTAEVGSEKAEHASQSERLSQLAADVDVLQTDKRKLHAEMGALKKVGQLIEP